MFVKSFVPYSNFTNYPLSFYYLHLNNHFKMIDVITYNNYENFSSMESNNANACLYHGVSLLNEKRKCNGDLGHNL